MGIFDHLDDLKDQVVKAAAEHPDVVEKLSDQVIERAGDAVDQVTGHSFAEYVDQGQQAADERVGE